MMMPSFFFFFFGWTRLVAPLYPVAIGQGQPIFHGPGRPRTETPAEGPAGRLIATKLQCIPDESARHFTLPSALYSHEHKLAGCIDLSGIVRVRGTRTLLHFVEGSRRCG